MFHVINIFTLCQGGNASIYLIVYKQNNSKSYERIIRKFSQYVDNLAGYHLITKNLIRFRFTHHNFFKKYRM